MVPHGDAPAAGWPLGGDPLVAPAELDVIRAESPTQARRAPEPAGRQPPLPGEAGSGRPRPDIAQPPPVVVPTNGFLEPTNAEVADARHQIDGVADGVPLVGIAGDDERVPGGGPSGRQTGGV